MSDDCLRDFGIGAKRTARMVLGHATADGHGQARALRDDREDLAGWQLVVLLELMEVVRGERALKEPGSGTGDPHWSFGLTGVQALGGAKAQGRIESERLGLALQAREVEEPIGSEHQDGLQSELGARVPTPGS